VIIKVGRSRLF